MKKIILILILCSVVLLNAKTWVREYIYQASEADSKLTSRAISLEQVKRLLLQEIGVYVHSTILNEEVEVSGELKELSAKQIEIISAGITETKIIEENWNGETYYIKAEITADENDVINRLDKVINDKEKTKQLEDSHRKTEEALTEIERLKQQLAQTQDQNEKLKLQKEYNQSSNELSAEDWFQKAQNAYYLEEYDNAILYLQKSIEIRPDFANSYYNLGMIYAEKKENDFKAIEYFQKVIELYPNHEESNLNIGTSYANLGLLEKAIKFINIAIEINPNLALAYFNMGIIHGKMGDYDKEIECYKKALKLNPKDVESLVNLGIAYTSFKGNHQQALECYEKALEINPKFGKIYSNMGLTYGYLGNYDKEMECFKKAVELDPMDPVSQYNLACVYYFEKSNLDKTIECCQKVIELDDGYRDAYCIMGFALFDKGEYVKTIESFQKVIEIDPEYSDAYIYMGNAYESLEGNEIKATELYKKSAKLGNEKAQNHLREKGISW